MRKFGDFRLKNLLDRIAGELKGISKESKSIHIPEYELRKSVCEQQEKVKGKGELPPN